MSNTNSNDSETAGHLRRAADLVGEVLIELEMAHAAATDGEVIEMVEQAGEVAGNMETTLTQVAEKADREGDDV
jgi:type II secretory pathway component PulF